MNICKILTQVKWSVKKVAFVFLANIKDKLSVLIAGKFQTGISAFFVHI